MNNRNRSLPDRIIEPLALVVITPLALSTIVYFGYVTAYSFGIFSEESFFGFFTDGIFRYRALGTWLFSGFCDVFPELGLTVNWLRFFDDCSGMFDPVFYSKLFYFNSMVFVALSSVMYIFYRKRFQGIALAGIMLFSQILAALGMFVFVHYDLLTYMFLFLGGILVLRDGGWLRLLLLSITLALATMTRETSILIISLFVTAYRKDIFALNRRRLVEFGILSLVYLGTYFGLRLAMGGSGSSFLNHMILLRSLSTMSHLIIFLFSLSLIYLITRENRSDSLWFLFFALPYILPVLYTGIQMEMRLHIPIVFGLLMLYAESRRETSRV